MCKIFAIMGFDDPKLIFQLASTAIPELSFNDSDGLGMIGITKDNDVWAERFLNNSDVFLETPPSDVDKYQSFGKFNNELKGLVIHTRRATSKVCIENVHPFYNKDTYLVHNGVVPINGLTLNTSTCDSEGILNSYVELNLAHLPNNFRYLYDYMDGWYACIAVYSRGKKQHIDVFKNHISTLKEVFFEGTNGFILCTSQHHAVVAAKKSGLKIKSINDFVEASLVRFNFDGELIDMYTDIKLNRDVTTKIKPFKQTYKQEQKQNNEHRLITTEVKEIDKEFNRKMNELNDDTCVYNVSPDDSEDIDEGDLGQYKLVDDNELPPYYMEGEHVMIFNEELGIYERFHEDEVSDEIMDRIIYDVI